MSDINANIVVSPIDLNVSVNTNQLSFTPDAISLNFYSGGLVTANSLNANINNVHISGGTNGYVLQTDGAGNLDWTAMTGGGGGNGSPGGANSQIQYNDSGSFAGNTGFTFTAGSGNLYVPGNVISPNFYGTANFALFAAAATTVTASSQPNITSVGNLVSLTVLGNSNTGNIYTSGVSGNISGANVITANTFVGNLTGNVSGNLSGTFTGNFVGNLSAGNITGNANVNLTSASNVSLGAVGNVHITGGSSNQYLKTDGSGTLSWATISTGSSSISNGNSNVNIATAAGNITMAVNGTTILTVSNANVTTKQFISNVATGTAPFVVTSNTIVANLNVANANYATTLYSLTTDSTVGSLTANSYVVPLNNNSASLGFTAQRFSNLFVGNIYYAGNLTGTNAPNAATSTTPTHKIPIVLNGVTYYICLTSTP